MEGINKVRIAGMFFISVIVLLIVSFPLEGVLLIGITFTLIFYYKSSHADRRKMRVYVATFCVIAGITVILGITSFRAVEGHLFEEEREGPEIVLGQITTRFPEDDGDYYLFITDCFEEIEIDVVFKIDVKKSLISSVSIRYDYIYDNEETHSVLTRKSLTLESDGDGTKAIEKITLGWIEQGEHENVTYRVHFVLGFKQNPDSFKASIDFTSSIDDDEDYYFYYNKKVSSLFEEDGVIISPPYLFIVTGVIIFSWLFAIVIFFVLRRLELLGFLSLLWSMVCIILLINHILIGLEDPKNIGLNLGILEIFKELTMFITIWVAVQQWSLTVGIGLVVIIITTKAFSSFGVLIKLTEDQLLGR